MTLTLFQHEANNRSADTVNIEARSLDMYRAAAIELENHLKAYLINLVTLRFYGNVQGRAILSLRRIKSRHPHDMESARDVRAITLHFLGTKLDIEPIQTRLISRHCPRGLV